MFNFINAAVGSFYNTLITVVWIILPVFLGAVFWTLRLYQKRIEFMNKIKWVMLEMNVPKDNIKTPKSMEQIFAALYGIYSFAISWQDKYLDGKVTEWVSLEMMGRGGGIHFYARIPETRRSLFESAVYAQYPEAEIHEAVDYVDEMPSVLPNDIWDLWGTGFVLNKDSAFPIRTYPSFEEVKEEKRVDPIANISEVMSKLKDDEMIWIQLLISPTGAPTGNDLKKMGDEQIKKIFEEKQKGATEEVPIPGMFRLTAPEQDVIKAMGQKIAKLAFQFSLRFVYIDKKNAFDMANAGAVLSSFQQFNTVDMNGFKTDKLKPGYSKFFGRLFPEYKKYIVNSKKRKLYDFYRKRRFGNSGKLMNEELPILNIEELATIYHFPTSVIRAPKLQTIYSRKGEPPVNLPIGR
jgi:hypothetical protein